MRKNLSLLVCAVAALMMLTTACKKDSKSPQELILGKWTFKTYSYKEVNGTDVNEGSDDMSAEGFYLDFKSDGKVTYHLWGGIETYDYTVKDAQTLILDGQTITLSTLTDKKLVIYTKATDPDYVYEEWMEFVK